MVSTTSALPIKPSPSLRPSDSGIRRQLRDLGWFFALWFRATPRHAALWVSALVVASVLGTVQLWTARNVLDAVVASYNGSSQARVLFWLSITALALVIQRVLGTLARFPEAHLRERGIPLIQAMVYQQSVLVDLQAYESAEFHDSAGRIATDLEDRTQATLVSLQSILSLAPGLIGNMVLLFLIDWRAAVALPLPAIPALLFTLKLGDRLFGFVREQTCDRRIATYLNVQLTSRRPAKEIRLFRLQEFLIARWSHHFLTTRDDYRRARFRTQLRGQVVGNVSSLIPMLLVVWLVFGLDVSLSAGDVVILVTLTVAVSSALTHIGIELNNLGEFASLASDVRSFTAMPPVFSRHTNIRAETTSWHGQLMFENVTYRYPGTSTNVIDGLSFVIQPTEHVAIVGKNGAGKTTLLKLALGLYQPDQGRVLLDGLPLAEIPVSERLKLFSAVFQHFTHYPFTVHENVSLNRDASGESTAVAEAIASVGMGESIANMPNGIETILSPDLGGVDLSGGQWQRLAIARARIHDAVVLALDEPTSALDPMAEVEIFQRFGQLAEGRTTLLVSHRLGMARLADRILVIEHGNLIEDGSHPELIARNGQYAHLWSIQSRWYQ